MRTAVILNPKSAGGKSEANLATLRAKLQTAFPGVVIYETSGEPASATLLTRQALHHGFERIVAVGGDGTLNETVNGFFENGQAINPKAIFSFVMQGRGNDFRRTFDISDNLDAALQHAAHGTIKEIDLGHLHFTGHDGRKTERFFLNVASFGMSGEVDQKVNQSPLSGILGGSGIFYLSLLQTVAFYHSPEITLKIDDNFSQTLKINTVAVANGRFFGGGMKIAPNAEVADGMFDIIIIKDISPLEIILQSPALYQGTHVNDSKIRVIRGKKVTATSKEQVLLDVDGEAPGRLPATFTIIPAALKIQI